MLLFSTNLCKKKIFVYGSTKFKRVPFIFASIKGFTQLLPIAMMPGLPTDPNLIALALQSFSASLREAEKQAEVKREEAREAIRKLSTAKQTVRDYKKLIAECSPRSENESKDQTSNTAPISDTNPAEDSDDDNDTTDGVTLKRKRERLNAPPRLLELITADGFFNTADELVFFLKREYGDRIKEKTSKNAVWTLNADKAIIKYYSKEKSAYIYGLPEWFSGGKPKTEHLKRSVTLLEGRQDDMELVASTEDEAANETNQEIQSKTLPMGIDPDFGF